MSSRTATTGCYSRAAGPLERGYRPLATFSPRDRFRTSLHRIASDFFLVVRDMSIFAKNAAYTRIIEISSGSTRFTLENLQLLQFFFWRAPHVQFNSHAASLRGVTYSTVSPWSLSLRAGQKLIHLALHQGGNHLSEICCIFFYVFGFRLSKFRNCPVRIFPIIYKY